MGKKEIDLNIDGPDSPISFKKFIESEMDPKEPSGFKVLIDNSGNGIASDHEGFLYLTPEAAKEQAIYFKNILFATPDIKGKKIPESLFRYMSQMYEMEKQFKSKQELANYLYENPDFYESEQYVRALNLIKNCEHNKESAQVIGLIMLFAGTIVACSKEKKSMRMLIEEPETHLHPKRERIIISVLTAIKNEYSPDKKKEDDN